MTAPSILAALIVLTLSGPLMAQPSIGGIVNAASYSRNEAAPKLAPGSIATIFGTNLAPSIDEARALPLPRNLLGTSVLFDGIEAPLFYVSPIQINLQVPMALLPPGTNGTRSVAVVVRTPTGQASRTVTIAPQAIGIFTANQTGTGPGAIVISTSDPLRLYLTPQTPARPGEFISVFATGMGATIPEVPDGEAVLPSGALPRAVASTLAVIGGIPSHVSYSGRSSYAGLDQINIEIPRGVQEGCAVPMQILVGLSVSQEIPLFIRTSGSCE